MTRYLVSVEYMCRAHCTENQEALERHAENHTQKKWWKSEFGIYIYAVSEFGNNTGKFGWLGHFLLPSPCDHWTLPKVKPFLISFWPHFKQVHWPLTFYPKWPLGPKWPCPQFITILPSYQIQLLLEDSLLKFRILHFTWHCWAWPWSWPFTPIALYTCM